MKRVAMLLGVFILVLNAGRQQRIIQPGEKEEPKKMPSEGK